MNAFVVELLNRPGDLARLAQTIADRGINITALSAAFSGESGVAYLVTSEEEGTRRALLDAFYPTRQVELVPLPGPVDLAALADALRQLADAGRVIDAILPTDLSAGTLGLALALRDPDGVLERERPSQHPAAGESPAPFIRHTIPNRPEGIAEVVR